MTVPRNRMPRPLPPSPAYVEVRPAGRTLLGRRRWTLWLREHADEPFANGLTGTLVVGSRDRAHDAAHAMLRRVLLPEERDETFRVTAPPPEPTRGPVGPSGTSSAWAR